MVDMRKLLVAFFTWLTTSWEGFQLWERLVVATTVAGAPMSGIVADLLGLVWWQAAILSGIVALLAIVLFWLFVSRDNETPMEPIQPLGDGGSTGLTSGPDSPLTQTSTRASEGAQVTQNSPGSVQIGGNVRIEQAVIAPSQYKLHNALQRAVDEARSNIGLTGIARVKGIERVFADILHNHPDFLHLSAGMREALSAYRKRLLIQASDHEEYSPWIGDYFDTYFIPDAKAFIDYYDNHPVKPNIRILEY